MLDVKLNSLMLGKKDILCIAIKKLGRYVVRMISVSLSPKIIFIVYPEKQDA